MKLRAQLSLVAAGLLVSLTLEPRQARACGGFFCSQVPIDQSGEQIIFSVTPNHVTAYIQISFQGKAQDFAWVVPVQTKPTLSVGSQAVFTALAQRTQPQYGVDWKFDQGSCGFPRPAIGFATGSAPKADPTAREDSAGVMVLDMREVGPYDSVTLSATDAGALVEWLNKNGFTQPPAAAPLIKHYVDLGMYFVALKLQQNAGAGDIQPIVLDMDNPEPCVPLILTQVAAIPDMPVQVYVLADTRAFPKNWFHVAVNERKIDWLNNGSNYKQVVNAAINEAAGHGFLTEFAGKSDFLKNSVFQEGRYDVAKLATITDPALFVQTLLQMGFPRDQSMQALLRKFIPMPASLKAQGVTEPQFYNNLAGYRMALVGIEFNPAAFAAALDERVIMPLRKAQMMMDAQPYLTRLYSTVSPDEMTRDPLFLLNSDLPPVSNIHRATGTAACNRENGMISNVVLTLPGGGDPIKIPGPLSLYNRTVPWAYATAEPAAARIELVSSSGAPSVYTAAQAAVADKYLDGEDADIVRGRRIPINGNGKVGTTPKTSTTPSSTCSFGGTASNGVVAAALLGLGLVLGRRRRR